MSKTAKLIGLLAGICALGLTIQASADTGCYRNRGMEHGTYWSTDSE